MSDAGGGAGSLPRGAAVDVLRWETNRSSRFGTLRITRPRGGIGILQRNLIDNPFRRPQIPAVIASERRSSAPLAAAAAIGSFVGSLAAGGVTQFWPRVAPSSSSVAASNAQAPNAEPAALSALKTLRRRGRLATPINNSPRWPIASTGSSARRPSQI